jgi:hypothetical protein
MRGDAGTAFSCISSCLWHFSNRLDVGRVLIGIVKNWFRRRRRADCDKEKTFTGFIGGEELSGKIYKRK